MKVEFGHINISKETRKKINKTLKKNEISQGKYVEEFESKFADFIGTKYAVAVSSGTAALTLMLASLERNKYNQVIVPALSFPATWASVVHARYKLMPIDINLNTLNIDEEGVARKINSVTKAVLPVHLMGRPVDLKVENEANENDIILLEDAAESHGSKINDRAVGTLGDMAAFSLYVSHILYAGEGGVITTNNELYFNKLRRLRNHGRRYDVPTYDKYKVIDGIDQRFIFDEIGYNFKITELQALIGLGSLEDAEKNISKRRVNFYYYLNEFKNFENYFNSYDIKSNEYISPHAFPIVLKENAGFTREEFMKHLQDNCIDCRTLFQSISSIKPYGINKKYPNAEYVEKNGLHIGVHCGINREKREYVIDSIKKFLEEKGR